MALVPRGLGLQAGCWVMVVMIRFVWMQPELVLHQEHGVFVRSRPGQLLKVVLVAMVMLVQPEKYVRPVVPVEEVVFQVLLPVVMPIVMPVLQVTIVVEAALPVWRVLTLLPLLQLVRPIVVILPTEQ